MYTWSAQTSEVKRLCDLSELAQPDSITSLSWVQRVSRCAVRKGHPPYLTLQRLQGTQLAVGTKNGMVQIWDAATERPIRRMSGHTARVGALSWNDAILTSGSHDRSILHRDVRIRDHSVARLAVHRQEVCGLKWNQQGDQLASGGNDNRLFVFDKMNEVSTMNMTLWQTADFGLADSNTSFYSTHRCCKSHRLESAPTRRTRLGRWNSRHEVAVLEYIDWYIAK